MSANELAKSVLLIGYLWINIGRARGSLLSLKQPTGSYGCSSVVSDNERPHTHSVEKSR